MNTLPITAEKTKLAEKSAQPARSEFVDGLRALCALFVVEHHIFYEIFESKQWASIDPAVQFLTGWLRHGYISVAGFIVLSGFCLMLPVVSSNRNHLSGGIKGFLLRRARRILPPYYAALALTLFLLVLVPALNTPSGFHWDWSLPALSKNAIVSHLFLVHNLNPKWITKINHPLWSIAIEWQIYFVFAILLMPIRKKLGIVTSIISAWIIACIPGVIFHTGDWTRPWYLGLFSLGMLAATIARSQHEFAVKLRNKVPWSLLTFIFGIVEICFASTNAGQTHNEIMTAFTLMCCLIWGGSFNPERATSAGKAAMNCLSAAPLVGIGIFSYSIYLLHAPIIALLRMSLESLSMPPTITYELLFVSGTTLSIAIGYGFFYLVERRFMSSNSAKQ